MTDKCTSIIIFLFSQQHGFQNGINTANFAGLGTVLIQLTNKMQTWLQILIVTTVLTPNECRWAEKDQADLFFDRVVDIRLNEEGVTSGILITGKHVLTSFNPFRVLCRSLAAKANITINALVARSIQNGTIQFYRVHEAKIVRARQIIPAPEDYIDYDNWHGEDKLHCPVNDLIVMLITPPAIFPDQATLTKFANLFEGDGEKIAGPIKTGLATSEAFLGRAIKIAGYGFLNEDHIYRNYDLRTHTYDEEDNVVTDCDEWIPKNWGYLICVRNIENYPSISSGAVLVYNDTVYGIGSFALHKGNRSVLVFTDVRPYHDLIFKTYADESDVSDE